MKVVFSCLFLITFLANQNLKASIGETEVPTSVKKSFLKKYPKHTEANWDDLGDLFVVNFYDEGDVLKEATFDPKGNWKETITWLDDEELPQIIEAYIKKKYGYGVEITEIILSEKLEGNNYYLIIEMPTEDENKEKKFFHLTFDSKGKFLKQE